MKFFLNFISTNIAYLGLVCLFHLSILIIIIIISIINYRFNLTNLNCSRFKINSEHAFIYIYLSFSHLKNMALNEVKFLFYFIKFLSNK